jgi:hypothetical protein
VDAVPNEVRGDAVPSEARDASLSLGRTGWGGRPERKPRGLILSASLISYEVLFFMLQNFFWGIIIKLIVNF